MKLHDYIPLFINLFRDNFNVQTGETVIVLHDNHPFSDGVESEFTRAEFAQVAKAAASELGADATVLAYEPVGSHGREPGYAAWNLITDHCDLDTATLSQVIEHKSPEATQKIAEALTQFDGPNVVLTLSHFSISHTRFRKWLTGFGGTRMATMPGFIPSLMPGVMQADWPAIKRRCDHVATLLTEAEQARIISGDASDTLTLQLNGRIGLPDTGILQSAGDFGNLPGGESFLAPIEQTAQGAFWAYASDGATRMKISVVDGQFAACNVDDVSVKPLIETNATNWRNLAELGVGTNESAQDCVNVLEAEKILGTCHIAFGDNAGFGGTVSAPFHRNLVIPDCTLQLLVNNQWLTVIDGGKFLES